MDNIGKVAKYWVELGDSNISRGSYSFSKFSTESKINISGKSSSSALGSSFSVSAAVESKTAISFSIKSANCNFSWSNDMYNYSYLRYFGCNARNAIVHSIGKSEEIIANKGLLFKVGDDEFIKPDKKGDNYLKLAWLTMALTALSSPGWGTLGAIGGIIATSVINDAINDPGLDEAQKQAKKQEKKENKKKTLKYGVKKEFDLNTHPTIIVKSEGDLNIENQSKFLFNDGIDDPKISIIEKKISFNSSAIKLVSKDDVISLKEKEIVFNNKDFELLMRLQDSGEQNILIGHSQNNITINDGNDISIKIGKKFLIKKDCAYLNNLCVNLEKDSKSH